MVTKSDRLELLELKVTPSFSKISKTLDKVFKSSSLESFHNRLLKKPPEISSNMWQDKIRLKNNNKLDRISDEVVKLPKLSKNSNFQKQFGSKSKLLNKSIEEEQYREPKINDSNPEPGKYNPNWNAVEPNSRKARFIGKAKDEFDHLMELKRNYSEQIIETNLSSNKKDKNKDKEAVEEGKESKIEYARREHYVNQKYNFDNYSPRSDIYTKPNETGVLTYCEPEPLSEKIKRMHRIVDFRKSADARSNVPYENNPSPCEYHPKMTLVDKNDTSPVIYKTEDKYKKKHYLVQKMWKSYNATIDYRIVQLKSYMEEQKEKKPIAR